MTTQELLQLNIADYVIVAVVAVSMLISLFRGFLKEFISLVVWVAGFWVAIEFYTALSEVLAPYITNVSVRLIISFIGLFLAVLILGSLFSYLLSFVVDKSGLGGFNRLLGMIFGCARGVLLVSVILLLISTTSFVQDEWWKKSVLIPHLQIIVDWLRAVLPQKITDFAGVISSPKK
jgi:membrane protein required for colicin V production